MTKNEMDELLAHLVYHFTRIDDGDYDPSLAAGSLEALAGDFIALHDALISGSPLPTDWS
jgi:hypothetical protein